MPHLLSSFLIDLSFSNEKMYDFGKMFKSQLLNCQKHTHLTDLTDEIKLSTVSFARNSTSSASFRRHL